MTSRKSPVVSRSGAWLPALLLMLLLSAMPSFGQSTTTNILTSATAQDLQAALDGGGTVILNFNGTITTANTLFITTDVILDATSNNITISGGGSARIFEVSTNVTFQIRNITLSGGRNVAPNGTNGTAGGSTGNYSPGGNGSPGANGSIVRGGAMINFGTCIVTNCLFLTNTVVAGNGGAGGAGGNSLYQGGTGGSGGNGGIAYGGAIYNLNSLLVSNCTFAGNSAIGGNGGTGGTNGSGSLPSYTGEGGAGGAAQGAAIYNAAGANVRVLACSFFGNFSEGGVSQAATTAPNNGGNGQNGPSGPAAYGGGIYNASDASVVNSTFFDNIAIGGNGGNGGNAATGIDAGVGGNGGNAYGGGIYNTSTGGIYVTSCTFDGGQVLGGTNGLAGTGSFTNGAGGIGTPYGANIVNNGGIVLMTDTILAYPTNANNSYGAITDDGYNISSDNTPKMTSTGSFNNLNPILGTLQNNGGPTETIAIAPNSPAKDKIPPNLAPAVDQRGFPRPIPVGGLSDIGAYEYGTAFYSVSGNVGAANPGILVSAIGTNSTLQVLTDSNGNYTFSTLIPGTYTIVPEATNSFSFSPSSVTVTVPPDTNVDFTATAAYFAGGVISNTTSPVTVSIFTNANGNNISVAQTTSVVSNGFYIFTNLPAGDYTIIPQQTSAYKYNPSSLVLTVPPSNTNENFTQVQQTYAISGVISNVSSPITIVATGNTITTGTSDSFGNYIISNLLVGPYVVTPTPTNNYTYTPSSIPIDVTNNMYNVDFVATSNTPNFYSLSGQITNMTRLVTVKAVSGTSTNSTSTDTNGNYSFTKLESGIYTVTPQVVRGIAFDPSSMTVALTSPKTNQNFAAEFSFTLLGTPDAVYRVQFSTNLAGPWQTISTNTAGTNGDISVTNSWHEYPSVFFRAVTP